VEECRCIIIAGLIHVGSLPTPALTPRLHKLLLLGHTHADTAAAHSSNEGSQAGEKVWSCLAIGPQSTYARSKLQAQTRLHRFFRVHSTTTGASAAKQLPRRHTLRRRPINA
jgi:hypothetical protein